MDASVVEVERIVDRDVRPKRGRMLLEHGLLRHLVRSIGRLCAMSAAVTLTLALLFADVSRADGYTLDTGDVLRVSVFGESSYPQEVVLDDRGIISLPLLGSVLARGQTPESLSQHIQNAFQQGHLIRDPFVKVEVSQYRPFFISGAVSRPGSYPFQPGITIRHALAIAGGFRPTVAGEAVAALQIADLRSERANLMIDEYRLRVRSMRLSAEIDGKDSFAAPPVPPSELKDELISDIIASEQDQMEARRIAKEDEIAHLEASLLRVKNEADMVGQTRAERERLAKDQLDQLESMRSLREQGLITNANVLALERTHSNYRADLAQAELQETRAHQEIMDLESRIRKAHHDWEFALRSEMQDAQVQLAKLQTRMQHMTDKLMFVSHYGGHRSFGDLRNSIHIAIYRRTLNGDTVLAANENSEIRAGDIIEVSVATNSTYYAPDLPGLTTDETSIR